MLLPTAEGEGRRVVLLGGEAGSGKSRLVREFAAEAAQSGALVLHGACDAVVHAPYGPFSQALERLAAVVDEDELRAALGASGGELIRLLPNLGAAARGIVAAGARRPGHRAPPAAHGRDGSARAGRPAASCGPGDRGRALGGRAYAAAAASPRTDRLGRARAAVRDLPRHGGTRFRTALAQTLADLRRSDDVVRMRLEGLSDLEVSEFVRRVTEGRASAELPEIAQAISNLTGGNAFLMCELWRALVGDGGDRERRGRAAARRLPARPARNSRQRPRGRERPSRALGAGDHRAARAGGDGGRRVPARNRQTGLAPAKSAS